MLIQLLRRRGGHLFEEVLGCSSESQGILNRIKDNVEHKRINLRINVVDI